MNLRISNEEFDTIIMNLWMHRKSDKKTKELYDRLKTEQKDPITSTPFIPDQFRIINK